MVARPKVIRTCGAFSMFNSKCASCYNGVHFFRHPNFQKWSESVVLLAFWLPNVLRATNTCTFSTAQPPNALRDRGFEQFDLETHSAPHWRAIFDFPFDQMAPHPPLFSEATLQPPGATTQWKNTAFCDCPTFSCTLIFFLLALSLLWSSFLGLAFLWYSPAFPPVDIFGSLAFKLSSILPSKLSVGYSNSRSVKFFARSFKRFPGRGLCARSLRRIPYCMTESASCRNESAWTRAKWQEGRASDFDDIVFGRLYESSCGMLFLSSLPRLRTTPLKHSVSKPNLNWAGWPLFFRLHNLFDCAPPLWVFVFKLCFAWPTFELLFLHAGIFWLPNLLLKQAFLFELLVSQVAFL